MEHYVGLDVSLKLTAICIVDQTGKIEREGMVGSNPEAIAAFIKSHAPHVARCVTGSASFYAGWRTWSGPRPPDPVPASADPCPPPCRGRPVAADAGVDLTPRPI
jgi:hypothetical protein